MTDQPVSDAPAPEEPEPSEPPSPRSSLPAPSDDPVAPRDLAPVAASKWWSRGLVALVALIVAAVVGIHLGATFLYNAPSNPVTQKFAGPIRDWMTPIFAQNWQLFAPDPLSESIDVQARGSISGNGQVTAWYDLSALDEQATLHNLAPTQITLNALRNAVLQWLDTHDSTGNPTSGDSTITQQYLSNLVVSRLQQEIGGEYGSIQVRLIFTLLPGPGRTAAQTAPQARTLNWWIVQP